MKLADVPGAAADVAELADWIVSLLGGEVHVTDVGWCVSEQYGEVVYQNLAGVQYEIRVRRL